MAKAAKISKKEAFKAMLEKKAAKNSGKGCKSKKK